MSSGRRPTGASVHPSAQAGHEMIFGPPPEKSPLRDTRAPSLALSPFSAAVALATGIPAHTLRQNNVRSSQKLITALPRQESRRASKRAPLQPERKRASERERFTNRFSISYNVSFRLSARDPVSCIVPTHPPPAECTYTRAAQKQY